MPTKKTRYPTALIRGTLRGRSTTSATTTRYPGPAPRPTSLLAVAGRHGSAAARAAPSVSRGSGASVSTLQTGSRRFTTFPLERSRPASQHTYQRPGLLMPGPCQVEVSRQYLVCRLAGEQVTLDAGDHACPSPAGRPSPTKSP